MRPGHRRGWVNIAQAVCSPRQKAEESLLPSLDTRRACGPGPAFGANNLPPGKAGASNSHNL